MPGPAAVTHSDMHGPNGDQADQFPLTGAVGRGLVLRYWSRVGFQPELIFGVTIPEELWSLYGLYLFVDM